MLLLSLMMILSRVPFILMVTSASTQENYLNQTTKNAYSMVNISFTYETT